MHYISDRSQSYIVLYDRILFIQMEYLLNYVVLILFFVSNAFSLVSARQIFICLMTLTLDAILNIHVRFVLVDRINQFIKEKK
jgi:hypothetical protein